MKKVLLIVSIFGLVTFNSYSQKLTIEEMINKTKCKTVTCFSDYITTKGFSYLKVSQEKGYKMYGFSSNKDIPNSSNDKLIGGKNNAWIFFQMKMIMM